MLEGLVFKSGQAMPPTGRRNPPVDIGKVRQVLRRAKDIVLVARRGYSGPGSVWGYGGGPRVGCLPDTLAPQAVARRLTRPSRGFRVAIVAGIVVAGRRAGKGPIAATALATRVGVPQISRRPGEASVVVGRRGA